MRGDGSVAGEGRVVGVPKFHSWAKCTMPLTNINSDWMSSASSGLCIILVVLINYIEQSNRTPRCSQKVSAAGFTLHGSNTLELSDIVSKIFVSRL